MFTSLLPTPYMPFTGELRAHHVGGRLPQERADGVRSLLLLLSLVLLLLLLLPLLLPVGILECYCCMSSVVLHALRLVSCCVGCICCLS